MLSVERPDPNPKESGIRHGRNCLFGCPLETVTKWRKRLYWTLVVRDDRPHIDGVEEEKITSLKALIIHFRSRFLQIFGTY